ncbi:MFS transporter small subunit [Demequina pelophila]|nr:hypothetical protein [Demequina pelophila]
MDKQTQPRVGNPLAVVLWVLVGTGLAFGIGSTVVDAIALFTG